MNPVTPIHLASSFACLALLFFGCVVDPNSRADSGTSSEDAAGGGGGAAGGGGVGGEVPAGDDGPGRGPGRVGERCQQDTDCMSFFCRDDVFTPYCTDSCREADDCPDGFGCERRFCVRGGGAGGDGEYTWVYILDISEEENRSGTAGVDVCGMTVECGNDVVSATTLSFVQGDGEVCQEIGQEINGECTARRNDPTAAGDFGDACDPASAPNSDYVSLGINGGLSLNFGRDLRGCDVTIIEHSGSELEAYAVFVCEQEFDDCLGDEALFTAEEGGNTSVTVPQ